MTEKIFRAIFSETMLILVSIVVLSTVILYNYYENQIHEQVQNDIHYVAEGVELVGLDYFKNLSSDSRITWINADGNVLYDNYVYASNLDNHKDREEIKEAIANGVGDAIRYSETMGKKTYNYAVRLDDDTILRISITSDTMLSLGITIFKRICWILLLAVIISVWLAYYLSKGIIQPINDMDLNNPMNTKVYSELTPLVSKLSDQNNKIQAQMQELKKKQQEFTAITENMQEGFLIINRKQEVISYNSAIIHFFGTGILQHKRDIVILREELDIQNLIDEALAGRRNSSLIDMRNRHYQIISSPINHEQNHLGAVIMIFDVTEKEEREKLRQEFTANVSHELKTPLTSISGFAEIIQHGMVRKDDIPKFAGNIYEEAQRLIQLVGDILKLSKLDENNILLERESVNLYELSQKIAYRLRETAAQRGILIKVQGIQGVVQGIEQILDEMIYNLCDNAIKYNNDNGEVRIVIAKDNGSISVSVSDTGIGIPKEECERIFERFYRVDKSHSKEVGGTGLGLSIVKHGAIVHRAQIHVDSVFGEGTTIKINFKPDTVQQF